jgi:hypothetical protein
MQAGVHSAVTDLPLGNTLMAGVETVFPTHLEPDPRPMLVLAKVMKVHPMLNRIGLPRSDLTNSRAEPSGVEKPKCIFQNESSGYIYTVPRGSC